MRARRLSCWDGLAALALLLPSGAVYRTQRRVATYPLYAVVDEPLPPGARIVPGEVRKHPGNPLVVQDRPWEPRCDNSYPNIARTRDPGAKAATWHLWYGCMTSGLAFDRGPGTNRTLALLYANSTDGLAWRKPDLGIYDLAAGPEAVLAPHLAEHGTSNNIVAGDADGVGVMVDRRAPDSTGRFKAFGKGCFGPGGATGCVEGVAASADGLHWANATQVPFPPPQAYDCHQNAVYDPLQRAYLLTSRARVEGEREVAMAWSPRWPPEPSASFRVVNRGSLAHQLYSQVTFRHRGFLLALVAVYDAEEGPGTVRCLLARHLGNLSWAWVGALGPEGPPFIPLGPPGSFDDHIVFPANRPLTAGGQELIFYSGGNGPHYGARNTSLGLATLRRDGFVGVELTGRLVTRPVICRGETLWVTADMRHGRPKAVVQVGLEGSHRLAAARMVPLWRNCTHCVAVFRSGAHFGRYIGRKVRLEVLATDARVFSVGFYRAAASPAAVAGPAAVAPGAAARTHGDSERFETPV